MADIEDKIAVVNSGRSNAARAFLAAALKGRLEAAREAQAAAKMEA